MEDGHGDPAASRLTIRPMSPEELHPFLEAAATGYAGYRVAAGDWPSEGAVQRALDASVERLPAGVATPGMTLLTGTVDDRPVGGVWMGSHPAEPADVAWLYEIIVSENDRGTGYGRALLDAAERVASEAGFTALSLNVHGHNVVARHLYDVAGYESLAVRMKKTF